MSMRLKGMLKNHLHAQLEQHMFDDATVLENVPCEMTFECKQGFMEFETEAHSYLPLMHLIGSITEVRGDFPFHISSLYFDNADVPYLTKDILYYPNPEEIAHMITVGKFYTKQFGLPDVLENQTYSFPARVNLTIVPPPNPAAYEIATYGGDFVAETDEEKLNLPTVYLELAGTGINRKNDKLLDYYGIDFESDYPMYSLTAESSGYVDPPLMMYIEEPQISDEDAMSKEDMKEMYITPEEEAALIREQKAREAEAQAQAQVEPTPDYQLSTSEDVLIAQASKNIEKRVGERLLENEKEKQAQRDALEAENEKSLESEQEDEMQETQEFEKTAESTYDPMMDLLDRTSTDDFIMVGTSEDSVEQPMAEGDYITSDEESYDNEDDYNDDMASEVEDTSSEEVIADEAMASEVIQPDTPQQQAEVKMDFDVEHNAFVEDERAEEKETSSDGLIDEDSDRVDMENMQGADVSDAKLQAKLDEAHTKDVSINAAVNMQDDIIEQDDVEKDVDKHDASDDKSEKSAHDGKSKIESRVVSDETVHKDRTVPTRMQEIADEYDVSRDISDDDKGLE